MFKEFHGLRIITLKTYYHKEYTVMLLWHQHTFSELLLLKDIEIITEDNLFQPNRHTQNKPSLFCISNTSFSSLDFASTTFPPICILQWHKFTFNWLLMAINSLKATLELGAWVYICIIVFRKKKWVVIIIHGHRVRKFRNQIGRDKVEMYYNCFMPLLT